MLKYLPLIVTTVCVNVTAIAVLVPIGFANALPTMAIEPVAQDKLIAKDAKPTHINADRQSEIKEIHQVLTQFFRGINEGDVNRVAKVTTGTSAQEKESLRALFAKIKADGVVLSLEVTNIELIYLSGSTASVKIDSTVQASKGRFRSNVNQSSSVDLVKQRGQWKVSDASTVIKSTDRRR